jgi:hypothetical protein
LPGPAPHLLRGGHRLSLSQLTNAERLRTDHAQTKSEQRDDVFIFILHSSRW